MAEAIPAIRKYKKGDRIYVRAQQIWLILVAFVMKNKFATDSVDNCKTITYGDIAILMGYPDARAGRTLSRQLGIIGHYCLHNNLPALNSIVVNKLTDCPGDHVVLTGDNSVKKEQSAVMKENWFQFGVPSTGALRKVRSSQSE